MSDQKNETTVYINGIICQAEITSKEKSKLGFSWWKTYKVPILKSVLKPEEISVCGMADVKVKITEAQTPVEEEVEVDEKIEGFVIGTKLLKKLNAQVAFSKGSLKLHLPSTGRSCSSTALRTVSRQSRIIRRARTCAVCKKTGHESVDCFFNKKGRNYKPGYGSSSSDLRSFLASSRATSRYSGSSNRSSEGSRRESVDQETSRKERQSTPITAAPERKQLNLISFKEKTDSSDDDMIEG